MKKKSVVLVGILVVLIAVLAVVFSVFKPSTSNGAKSVEISVVNSMGEITTYKVNTNGEYLVNAMDDAEGLSYEGEESEYGLMVIKVNDEEANYNVDGAYWAFYVNGDYCEYGVDSQPVADGDKFSIEYTK